MQHRVPFAEYFSKLILSARIDPVKRRAAVSGMAMTAMLATHRSRLLTLETIGWSHAEGKVTQGSRRRVNIAGVIPPRWMTLAVVFRSFLA